MRRFLYVISALCFSTALVADEYTGHPYVAFQGGYGVSTLEKTGVNIVDENNEPTGKIKKSSLPNTKGATYGESVGVHLNNQIRFELNHMKRHNRKNSDTPDYFFSHYETHIDPETGEATRVRVREEGNIAKTTFEQDTYMLQAYYKFAKGFLGVENIWSFVGAGVGAAKTKVNLVDILGSGRVLPGYTKEKWSPAVAAMLGLTYDINRALALDAELKYTYTDAKTKETQDNHNFDALVGMRVNF